MREYDAKIDPVQLQHRERHQNSDEYVISKGGISFPLIAMIFHCKRLQLQRRDASIVYPQWSPARQCGERGAISARGTRA